MSCIGLLLALVLTEGLDVVIFFLSFSVCFVATIIAMLRHKFSVSLGILLSLCRDIVSIFATFLLLFALSFCRDNGEICHNIKHFLP